MEENDGIQTSEVLNHTHLQAIRVTAPPYSIISLMHKIKLIHTTQSRG